MDKGKIRELSELAKMTDSFHAANRIVVHCHGVFDLLHVGHIRHLEQAKKLGDVLCVTLTADRYVNKGPQRPAFTQQLRAEAIAALECVDYVAVNDQPTAVNAIQMLRPEIYVKGSDYSKHGEDRTGGITMEDEAVKSVGGELIFTNEIVFSSSSLINEHTDLLSDEVRVYLREFSALHPPAQVIHYLDNAESLRVLIVGETILDEYLYCEAIGKSSKEPMLAVKKLSTERFAGGVLAVANHVANFCDDVTVVTQLGVENSEKDFLTSALKPNVTPRFLYRRTSPTIVKQRYIDSYFFTKLLEVYEMDDGALDPVDDAELCAALEETVPHADVVIVLDFGHSMMSKNAIRILTEKAKFLAVNTQANAGNLGYNTISRYAKADFVSLAESEVRLEMRDRRGDIRTIVSELASRSTFARIAVTQGSKGCLCFDQEHNLAYAPALAGKVVDRVGAGDAFLSIASLCVAQGAPMDVVAFIGNAVAAQAVATVGHRNSVDRVALIKQIEALLK